MAQERLAPDAILASTNLSGAVSAIQDDPDSPDGSWLTAPGSNNSTEVRVSFGTPAQALTAGAGLQGFRVQVRKTNHSTDPSCTIELYENGSFVATLVSGQTVSSTSGVVLQGTWDATGRTAANIECRVTGSTGGGSPGNRASLEVGAIEWNAETETPSSTGTLVATTTASAVYAGTVKVAGTIAAPTEANAALVGGVKVTGPLASSVDVTAALAGTVKDPAISGTLSSSVADAAASLAGGVKVTGALSATTEGSANLTGRVAVAGSLSASSDATVVALGQVVVAGLLDSALDDATAALSGGAVSSGTLAAVSDSQAAFIGGLLVKGDLVATTEAAAAFSGGAATSGVFTGTIDAVSAFVGGVAIAGPLVTAVSELTFAGLGSVKVAGTLAAQPTATANITGSVTYPVLNGTLAASVTVTAAATSEAPARLAGRMVGARSLIKATARSVPATPATVSGTIVVQAVPARGHFLKEAA